MDAAGITDEQIRSYLLGALDDSETERIDELTVIDEHFAAKVESAERDLVDEFVRGELETGSRRQFEAHYLRSPLRREKLQLAQSFNSIAGTKVLPEPVREEREEQTASVWDSFWFKLGAVAFAGTLLTALAIPIWYGWSSEGELARSEPAPTAPPDRQGGEVDPTPVLMDPPQPTPTEPAATLPTNTLRVERVADNRNRNRNRPPAAFALTLLPQTRGVASEKRVKLPTTARTVAVTLRMEPNDFSDYLVELADRSSGEVVWKNRVRSKRSAVSPRSLRFEVPSRTVSNGNLRFSIKGVAKGKDPELIGDYPFTVVQ